MVKIIKRSTRSKEPLRPTKTELRAARNKSVPDVIAPRLKVLFVGINPGLYSGAVGRHFARPGNRFWPALQHAGLTPGLLSPYEERELLKHGCGITNLVNRATATAAELTARELRAGRRRLTSNVQRYRPRIVAVLGLGAYQAAFACAGIRIGEQENRIGNSRVWVLPNPSGLNAHYQTVDFARFFRRLRRAAEKG